MSKRASLKSPTNSLLALELQYIIDDHLLRPEMTVV